MKTCLKSSIRTFIKKNRMAGYLIAACLVLLLFLMSLTAGAAGVTGRELLCCLAGLETETRVYNILWHIRIPRSLAALVTGSALAGAGLLLQAALNNRLAASSTIGVNSGAGFFVVLSSVLFPGVFVARSIAGFLGAFLTAMFVYGVARKIEGSKSVIIMTGIAVSSMLSAALDVLVTIWPESLMDKSAFYIGGFSHTVMNQTLQILPFFLIGLLGALLLSCRLNLLALGDEVAASLGLKVEQCRFLIIASAAILAASAVCIGGLLGFVGLIVPHLIRGLAGNDYRQLVPFTLLAGGGFTLICDMLARTLFAPYELPVGILLSFLGGPFFLYLLVKKKRRVFQ